MSSNAVLKALNSSIKRLERRINVLRSKIDADPIGEMIELHKELPVIMDKHKGNARAMLDALDDLERRRDENTKAMDRHKDNYLKWLNQESDLMIEKSQLERERDMIQFRLSLRQNNEHTKRL